MKRMARILPRIKTFAKLVPTLQDRKNFPKTDSSGRDDGTYAPLHETPGSWLYYKLALSCFIGVFVTLR